MTGLIFVETVFYKEKVMVLTSPFWRGKVLETSLFSDQPFVRVWVRVL